MTMNNTMQEPQASEEGPRFSKIQGWVILLTTIFMLWLFGVAIGPWLQHHIYGMDQIVQVVEEQDIDAGAYFYTEIEGSYAGGRYLRQALKMGMPEEYGVTLSFLSGIILCFFLLFLGWKYLPE
jgi:hypothetical protein